MLKSNSIGTIEGLEPSAHVIAILAFLENHLNGFVIKYESEYRNISNEIGITQKLEMYLNPFLKVDLSTFNLTKEYIEDTSTGQSSKCDLGFYLDGEDMAIFCIEAKRLPTPESKREKEYVIGHWNSKGKYVCSGGIERFKKDIHGKGLSHSAIIGYVQKNNFNYWFSLINGWIGELISNNDQVIVWNNEDKLQKQEFAKKIAKLQSHHKRLSDTITIMHYWIDLRSIKDIVRDRLLNAK